MNNDKNVNVGSYDSLDSGVHTIHNTSDNLKRTLEEGNELLKNIHKSRVFEGPIADHVNGMWNKLSNLTNSSINTLNRSGNTLDEVNNSYQATDKASSDKVGDVI